MPYIHATGRYNKLSHTLHCTDVPCTRTGDFCQSRRIGRSTPRPRTRPTRTATTPPPATSACMCSAQATEATDPPPPGRSRTLHGHRGLLHDAAEQQHDAADEVDERPVDGDLGELAVPPPRARPSCGVVVDGLRVLRSPMRANIYCALPRTSARERAVATCEMGVERARTGCSRAGQAVRCVCGAGCALGRVSPRDSYFFLCTCAQVRSRRSRTRAVALWAVVGHQTNLPDSMVRVLTSSRRAGCSRGGVGRPWWQRGATDDEVRMSDSLDTY